MSNILTQGRDIAFLPVEDKFERMLVRSNAASVLLTSSGVAAAATGTATARTPNNTDWLSSQVRVGLVSAAGAGSLCGIRDNGASVHWRGDASNRGGFVIYQRFGLSTVVADERFFCGLRASTAAPADVEPSSLTDIIGVGFDGADATMQVMHNDAAGTATRVPLGAGFPKAAVFAFDLLLSCDMNGGSVNYKVTRLDVVSAPVTGNLSTNLPALTTFLSRYVYASNNATASTISVEMLSMTTGLPMYRL